MKKIKRAIHLDFHTMPGIYDFGKEWDASDFAKTLKEAHVTFISAFAMCNLGYCYYPTKIGVPYPGIKINLFGSLVEACHKEGIQVAGYVSTGLNHEQTRLHPEWSYINADGQIISGDRTGNFFRMPCYNTGYREHILGIMKEVLSLGVDGLFCDNVGTWVCYCNNCTEKMLTQNVDIGNSNAVRQFALQKMLDFAKDIRAIVPKGKYLRLNVPPAGFSRNFNTHSEIECLPSSLWGYDFFSSQVAYHRNVYEQVVYMTGRFQRDWGDFGGLKTKASLENDIYDALCNNAQVSVGDHMHPRGRLEPAVYKTIGETYKLVKQYELWTDGALYVPEIGVVMNKDFGEADLPAYRGIARMMGELKYNFDIVDEEMDFTRFKLLILPDCVVLNEKIAAKIQDFLVSGKPVLSSGTSGVDIQKGSFVLDEWNYLKNISIDYTKTSYYRNCKNIRYPDSEMAWGTYIDGIFMKTSEEEQVVAAHIKPYFDRHWDGLHGYFYTPPEKETNYAAAAKKGNTAHISFKIFEAYYQYCSKFHKDLVAGILADMLPQPLIHAPELPSTSCVTITETDCNRLVHVKVTYPETRGAVNIIEEHNILPAGRKIALLGEYISVKHVPGDIPLEFVLKDGYTEFILPQIEGYSMFIAAKF